MLGGPGDPGEGVHVLVDIDGSRALIRSFRQDGTSLGLFLRPTSRLGVGGGRNEARRKDCRNEATSNDRSNEATRPGGRTRGKEGFCNQRPRNYRPSDVDISGPQNGDFECKKMRIEATIIDHNAT